MRRYFLIRARIFLRQSRWGFAVMGAWFAFGTLLFWQQARLPLGEAFLNAVYLARTEDSLWDVYSFWGQCVLFGIVISVFLLQAVQSYNPQEGARMLAREMKDHAIVVGYSHLGTLIVRHFQEAKKPFVLIEKDTTLVDELLRAGEPVIVDNAREASTLEDAGVAHAKLIVITSNDIETALLVTKRARDRNRAARIIVRCYLDEFTEILEGLGASEIISSSKSAFGELRPRLDGV
jgi:hypothetical protein